jgi:hypothetical protein
VNGLFEANPRLAQYFQTDSGIEPHELLTELDRTRRLVGELAAQAEERISPVEEIPGAVMAGAAGEAVVEVDAGTAAARHLEEAVSFAHGLVEEGRLEVNPRVAAQLEAGLNVDERQAFTPELIAVVNQAINEYGGDDAPARVNLARRAFRVTFDEDAWQPFHDLTLVSGASDTQAEVLTRANQLRSAALTKLGLDTASWSTDLVSQLDDHDRAILRDDADRSCNETTAVATPPEIPQLTALGPDAAQTVVTALAPFTAYERMLRWAHVIEQVGSGVVKQRTPLHPVMAAPQFPRPLVERLRAVDPDWVLGGVRELEPNSIVLLSTNDRFVESFVAGANHEMARELLWRGFPTDLRGSCFPRFWPAAPTMPAASDTTPVHAWIHGLGDNGPRGPGAGGLSVVVVKGELLRRYPATIVTAEHGTWSIGADGVTTFTNDGPVAHEVFRGFLDPDVTYVALDRDVDTLLAYDADHPNDCWYLSFRQPIDEPRFGLDEADPAEANEPNRADDPDHWSWGGLAGGAGQPHLTPEAVFAADNSAKVAKGLFQRPFRLLLRARDYLPGGG